MFYANLSLLLFSVVGVNLVTGYHLTSNKLAAAFSFLPLVNPHKYGLVI